MPGRTEISRALPTSAGTFQCDFNARANGESRIFRPEGFLTLAEPHQFHSSDGPVQTFTHQGGHTVTGPESQPTQPCRQAQRRVAASSAKY